MAKEEPKVILSRFISNDKETLGTLNVIIDGRIEFICKTLELPDANNAPQVSCIPKGKYNVVWSLSPSFKKYTYEVLNVPNRKGIRIHSANYYHQLLGCIALGDVHKDINADDQLDVIHSGATLAQFEKLLEYKSFILVIK